MFIYQFKVRLSVMQNILLMKIDKNVQRNNSKAELKKYNSTYVRIISMLTRNNVDFHAT